MVSRPRDCFVLALVVVGDQLGGETKLTHPFYTASSSRTGSDQTLLQGNLVLSQKHLDRRQCSLKELTVSGFSLNAG